MYVVQVVLEFFNSLVLPVLPRNAEKVYTILYSPRLYISVYSFVFLNGYNDSFVYLLLLDDTRILDNLYIVRWNFLLSLFVLFSSEKTWCRANDAASFPTMFFFTIMRLYIFQILGQRSVFSYSLSLHLEFVIYRYSSNFKSSAGQCLYKKKHVRTAGTYL